MSIPRRAFLHHSLIGGVAALLLPHAVLAEWPKAAFEAKSTEDALKALFDDPSTTVSGLIDIKAPDIAENGRVVPVEIDASGLNGVESITLIAEKNPVPLIAKFQLTESAVPQVATRIKMGGTSDVIAVVKAEGKLYVARKEVKVTIGGCGG
jgi:sulfur-oxidizing protein SoxY